MLEYPVLEMNESECIAREKLQKLKLQLDYSKWSTD